MNSHIVTYDLLGTTESSAEYERLIKRIKTYAWAKLQYSALIIRSSDSAVQIRGLPRGRDGQQRSAVRRQVERRGCVPQRHLYQQLAEDSLRGAERGLDDAF